MSQADYKLLNNYISILKDGEWDLNENVRPKWSDGKPAHTIKKFGIVNRYNLQEEFPISGVRKTNWKGAIDEIIWIWLLKSNNVKDLNSKIWDQWANIGNKPGQEIGSIGKAYGYQLGAKTIVTKNGKKIDQVDNVINELITNPANRRILTEIFNHSELHEMNLAPCVHEATFNVSNGTLNMTLNQRSNDTLAAGSWNVVQYAALLHMMAQATGLKAGELLHVVTDSHCYDKHVPMELEIIFNRCTLIQKKLMTEKIKELEKVYNGLKIPRYQINEVFKQAFKTDDEEVLNDLYDMYYIFRNNKYGYDDQFKWINNMYKLDGKLKGQDYKTYLDFVVKTESFKTSDRIIQKMLNNKKLDATLGFSNPKLILDPNVKNFYDFKSPKISTGTALTVEDGKLIREGKIVDNPNSSFNVIDYNPEIEGKELPMRVPVAE